MERNCWHCDDPNYKPELSVQQTTTGNATLRDNDRNLTLSTGTNVGMTGGRASTGNRNNNAGQTGNRSGPGPK